ncbi:response regulator [Foetidibacter luteolus]|uniref:response regulator n=1 Tax=Foetidibacter luteolus TaxID=2608880 RepID=UPI00129B1868|nr:response regulator [Foetidibacter luteolus]
MKPTSIFIVDDDSLHRSVVKLHLNSLGYRNIHCFPSGEVCIDNLHLKADIVFLDYMMTAMDGMEAMKIIKARRRECFIVFVSAQNNLEAALNALKSGAHDYIEKGREQLKKIEAALCSIQSCFDQFTKSPEETRSFLVRNRWYNGFVAQQNQGYPA